MLSDIPCTKGTGNELTHSCGCFYTSTNVLLRTIGEHIFCLIPTSHDRKVDPPTYSDTETFKQAFTEPAEDLAVTQCCTPCL